MSLTTKVDRAEESSIKTKGSLNRLLHFTSELSPIQPLLRTHFNQDRLPFVSPLRSSCHTMTNHVPSSAGIIIQPARLFDPDNAVNKTHLAKLNDIAKPIVARKMSVHNKISQRQSILVSLKKHVQDGTTPKYLKVQSPQVPACAADQFNTTFGPLKAKFEQDTLRLMIQVREQEIGLLQNEIAEFDGKITEAINGYMSFMSELFPSTEVNHLKEHFAAQLSRQVTTEIHRQELRTATERFDKQQAAKARDIARAAACVDESMTHPDVTKLQNEVESLKLVVKNQKKEKPKPKAQDTKKGRATTEKARGEGGAKGKSEGPKAAEKPSKKPRLAKKSGSGSAKNGSKTK